MASVINVDSPFKLFVEPSWDKTVEINGRNNASQTIKSYHGRLKNIANILLPMYV